MTFGFSIDDVAFFLDCFRHGEAFMVQEDRAQYRLTFSPQAEDWSADVHESAGVVLRRLYDDVIDTAHPMVDATTGEKRLIADPARRITLDEYLARLPLRFERFHSVPFNSRPIDSPLLLGPADDEIEYTRRLPELPAELLQRIAEIVNRHAP